MTKRPLIAAIGAMALIGAAPAGQWELPNPEAYARAADRERARLLTTPCSDADIGRGCYRYNGRAVREMPCTYHIDADTIGSIPTDRCYKMEKPRRYRGVWIDAFEGQQFIPEGATPPEWPTIDPKSPAWRAQFERARAAAIWLNVERVGLAHAYRKNGRRVRIEFVGRKTLYPGAYGHMGLSANEIIVDRVISVKEVE